MQLLVTYFYQKYFVSLICIVKNSVLTQRPCIEGIQNLSSICENDYTHSSTMEWLYPFLYILTFW